MRFIFSILCLLFLGVAGCDPAQEVRNMREKERQMQKENNEKQLKKAMENFNTMYEGLDKAAEPSSDSRKP